MDASCDYTPVVLLLLVYCIRFQNYRYFYIFANKKINESIIYQVLLTWYNDVIVNRVIYSALYTSMHTYSYRNSPICSLPVIA